ncbi:MAG: hypothetical protein LBU53_07570 [Zoogloeaceae bacterium]|jgi:hypothetical protein|nr:hypothetical protein [Zoogloeaceae bacterium]
MNDANIPKPASPRFDLKVNAAGSWSRCGTFTAHDYPWVRANCVALANLSRAIHRQRLVFKTLNEDGSVIEHLQAVVGEVRR